MQQYRKRFAVPAHQEHECQQNIVGKAELTAKETVRLAKAMRLALPIGQTYRLHPYCKFTQSPGPHADAIPRQFSYCLVLCALKTQRCETYETFHLHYFATFDCGSWVGATPNRPNASDNVFERHKHMCSEILRHPCWKQGRVGKKGGTWAMQWIWEGGTSRCHSRCNARGFAYDAKQPQLNNHSVQCTHTRS